METTVLIWLIAGAGLIAFEALTAPGLGIFLAGLGAFCTAIIIQIGIIDATHHLAQFAWFFGLTSVWAAVLWKPLKKFRTAQLSGHKGQSEYKDMVGGTAIIGKNGLRRGETGQALWSGTLMNARIADHTLDDFLPEGTHVHIVSVSGIVLHVSPNKEQP